MPLKKSKIIVLHNTQYSDSHLILKGLNQEGEVLSFIARFALKKNSSFTGGVLEPGKYIQIEYQENLKEGGMHKVKKASLINSFLKIRKDYDRLQIVLTILQTINKVSTHGIQRDKELFNLLGNTMIELEKTDQLELLRIFFEARFLYLQGVLPTSLRNQEVFLKYSILNYKDAKVTDEHFKELRYQMDMALTDYLN